MRKIGYAGKPYPFVDVASASEGELQVRGPNVFPGYWRNPEATRDAFTDDGWLRTGDVAERDDEGFYWIKGRLKDMYISGGENVYPAEVEAVLHEHPHVADAAVVGVPDERWGEVGVAFVVADGVVGDEELRRAAATGSHASRCRRPCGSSASCRATRWARCGSRSCGRDGGRAVTGVAPASTGARSRSEGVETRRRLLEAAEHVFGDLGYHDASIVKITEAAGVGQGTFYLYFASKKDIFDELVRDLNDRIRRRDAEGRREGQDAARGGAARLPGVLPSSRPSTRRCTASSGRRASSRPRSSPPLRADLGRLREALREAIGRGRRGDRPRGDGLGADGHERGCSGCAGSSGATASSRPP